MFRTICWTQHTHTHTHTHTLTHTQKQEKIDDEDRKALYKLIYNVVYAKTMKNLRSRINIKLVSNKKDYLKWISKPSYLSHKIFDNDLVVIRKNKVRLTRSKSAYTGMCILELSKVLI